MQKTAALLEQNIREGSLEELAKSWKTETPDITSALLPDCARTQRTRNGDVGGVGDWCVGGGVGSWKNGRKEIWWEWNKSRC